VLIAAVCTSVMFVGLTALACFVKTEKMSYCWALMSVLTSLALPLVIFMLIFRDRLIHTAVSVIFVALASLYIVYDTKQILKTLTVDEYIIGSLLIYVDIIQLFLWLVSLFGTNN
jgi:FtsH-binding integral membrane protein